MSDRRIHWKNLPSLLLVAMFSLLPVISSQAAELLSFESGKQAFEGGEFQAAFHIFQQLVAETPGDPELDFLLGRSAFESGDFETAIFAFERVLMARPEADRARLELGRSYFELGEFESARSSFRQVLDHNPPANVRVNIERYLRRIDAISRQHQFSGMLALAVSYDSNANYSPTEGKIQTIIGEVPIEDSQEDFIGQTTLELKHLYRQHPSRPGWLTGVLLYNASYFDQQRLNLNLFGLNTGPLWQQGNWQGKLQGAFNYLTLDDDQYLTTVGLELEETWQRGASFGIGLHGALTYFDYDLDPRDATQYRLAVQPVWVLGQNRLSVDLGAELTEAQDDQYGYQRFLVKIALEKRVPWQLTMNLSGRWQDSAYDAETPLFGKTRHDQLREINFGLQRPLWDDPTGTGQLFGQLIYDYTDTRSNIDLYRYNKQVVTVSLSYLF